MSISYRGLETRDNRVASYGFRTPRLSGCLDFTTIDIPVSAASIEKEATKIYPNPASYFINIELPEAELVRKCSVIDVSGGYHLQQTFGNILQNLKLNMSKVPNGLYSLLIETESTLIIRTIIVQNE